MKTISRLTFLLAIGLGFAQISAQANSNEKDYKLRFQSGSVTPAERQFEYQEDSANKNIRTAIVQFYSLPSAKDLVEQGFVPLNSVSGNAVVAQLPENFKPGSDPNIRWVGSLTRTQKLSPIASRKMRSETIHLENYLVYYFSNTDNLRIDQSINGLGLQQLKNSGLPDTVRVIKMASRHISQIADLNEVYWVMPAPDSLMTGSRFAFCPGPMTPYGPQPEFLARTDGWDGPGFGASDLFYHFVNGTADIAGVLEHQEIRDALTEWTLHADLTFTETQLANQASSFDIAFEFGNHGDNNSFDGPGGVLAHAFYSPPVNNDPIAGDMHFDDAETWRIGANWDIFSVALHEAGHSLGLNHSDVNGAVMLPSINGVYTELSQDDIDGIQSIYAAAPTSNDTDGDGVLDNVDNCTLVANAPQRDTDGDGYGNFCDADLNNDRIVNFLDLGLLTAVFFTTDPDGDFNGDGNVNFLDLGIIKILFFQEPGPSAVGMIPPQVPTISMNADAMIGNSYYDVDGTYEVLWTTPVGAVTYNLNRYRETPGGQLLQYHDLTSYFILETNVFQGIYEYEVQACDSNGLCSAFSPRKLIEVDLF